MSIVVMWIGLALIVLAGALYLVEKLWAGRMAAWMKATFNRKDAP